MRPGGLLAALLIAACGGAPKESVRSVAGPPLTIEAPPVDAGAPVSEPPPSQAPPAPEPNRSSAAPSAPLPVTTKLARGTGSPADAAMQAGDAAFDADDFNQADLKYREAAGLAPKEAGPLVGLARVAIAKTNLPTDYNAAPKHPVLEK